MCPRISGLCCVFFTLLLAIVVGLAIIGYTVAIFSLQCTASILFLVLPGVGMLAHCVEPCCGGGGELNNIRMFWMTSVFTVNMLSLLWLLQNLVHFPLDSAPHNTWLVLPFNTPVFYPALLCILTITLVAYTFTASWGSQCLALVGGGLALGASVYHYVHQTVFTDFWYDGSPTMEECWRTHDITSCALVHTKRENVPIRLQSASLSAIDWIGLVYLLGVSLCLCGNFLYVGYTKCKRSGQPYNEVPRTDGTPMDMI
jgi:hypothetical protein